MKNILRTAVLFAAFLFGAYAQGASTTKQLFVRSGEKEVLVFDSAPDTYDQKTGENIVRVIYQKGAKSATFEAVGTSGTSKIVFSASSGATTIVEVVIIDEIDDLLPVVRDEAAELGLKKVTRSGNRIRITGRIGTPREWGRYERLLERYKGKVWNDVEFEVNKSTIDALRSELVAAGVPLAPEGTDPEEGQIAMVYESNVLSFSGVVYSAGAIDKLVRMLRTKSWLALVNEAPPNASTTPKAQAIVSVALDDSMLEADIAFLLVSREEVRKAGSKTGFAVKGAWAGFWEFLSLDRISRGSKPNFKIDASLASTLEMTAGETFVRDKKTGHFLFKANGTPIEGDDATMRIGGTLKFTPPASGEGEAPQPQDFEYGFKVVNRGCHRVSADAAEIIVKVDVDGPPRFDPKVVGSAIRQEKTSFPLATVTCAFGKTVAMSGFGHTGETTEEPSGTPIFRHIPIMNWFVSHEQQEKEELDMLMLVSVRKVGDEDEPMVENDKMNDITYDANRSNRERIDEEKEKNKKFHGCWEPLNWFTW